MCNNVQKSALKSANVQRTGKSIFQMFAFSFFEGSHICRFYILRRKVNSAWESRFCVGNGGYAWLVQEGCAGRSR